MKKYDTKLLFIGFSIVGIIVVTIIGLTYAFFTASVGGNENANQTVITTAELRLVFNDTDILDLNNALPGASTSKTFTVQNTGNVRQKYDIDIVNVTNTFINDELTYTITSNNEDGGEVLETSVPTEESTLLTSYIDPGVTITYTITLKFKETGSAQDHNQGAVFNGKLQIVPRIMGVALGGYIYGDDDNVLSGVTVELHSDPIITTTDTNGYYEILDALIGTHTLYIKQGEIVLGSKEITLASSSESKINNNQELSLPDKIKSYVNVKIDNGLNIYLKNKPNAMEKILASNTAQSDTGINFDSIDGNGLYYTLDTQYGEDGETIYYFRGRVDNNWVAFGGFLWRIVRTTSEGGIKLVYSGDGSSTSSGFIGTGTTKFNANYNSKYYVGYTFNTGLDGYTGAQSNSNIKTAIDNWYNANLKAYESYLSTEAIYCSDRSSERISGSNIYYPGRDRIAVSPYRPTYACPDVNESRYTVSEETGNGYLENPIGLLTAEEINYAGVRYSTGSLNSYIMHNASSTDWWTMSPYNFTGSYAYVFRVYGSGYLSNSDVGGNSRVRPVVSLKPDVMFSGGDGSQANPYIVE